MTMKRNQLMGMLATGLLWAGMAQGQSSTNFTFAVNSAVPDATPLGLTLATNLSGMSGAIIDVNVTLNITGGFNGDLYAYLAGPNGGFAVLLNRAGVSNNASAFGYSTAGLNVTLDDAAANSIHYYQNFSFTLNGGGQLTGTWQPDGINIDPLSAPGSFLGAGQTALLSSLNGTDANGTWTLFLADLSSGGNAMLVDWGLQIAIPEPAPIVLGVWGLAIFGLLRRFKSPRAA
jgi:subtilisin-like proprotein convertase family protein